MTNEEKNVIYVLLELVYLIMLFRRSLQLAKSMLKVIDIEIKFTYCYWMVSSIQRVVTMSVLFI